MVSTLSVPTAQPPLAKWDTLHIEMASFLGFCKSPGPRILWTVVNLHPWIFSHYCGFFCPRDRSHLSILHSASEDVRKLQSLGDQLCEASGNGIKMGMCDGETLGLVPSGLQSSASAASRSHSNQMVTFTSRLLWSTTLNFLFYRGGKNIANNVGFIHFPSQGHTRRGNIPMDTFLAEEY